MSAHRCLPAGLLILSLAAAVPPLRAAEPICAEAKAMDTTLETALAAVAREAAGVPGERFLPLWRENLTGLYSTSDDPRRQAEVFRRERRPCVPMPNRWGSRAPATASTPPAASWL